MSLMPSERMRSASSPRRRSLVVGALLQRCPRCREGRLFKSLFTMNDPCPVCGLPLERESGYYLGAMYFSYFLGISLLVPLFYLAMWLLPEEPILLPPLVASLVYLPLVPLVFRYSRTLWIYFDRFASPTEVAASRGWMSHRYSEEDAEASPPPDDR